LAIHNRKFTQEMAPGQNNDGGFVAGRAKQKDSDLTLHHQVQLPALIALVKDNVAGAIISNPEIVSQGGYILCFEGVKKGNFVEKSQALG
jgi:hypothetical protein